MAELIDRQALIKRLKVWDTPDTMDKILYNFALNRALEMPAIDAEPTKHGRWIDYGKRKVNTVVTVLKCSKCGSVLYWRGNYCPNCGARMDLDEVEE